MSKGQFLNQKLGKRTSRRVKLSKTGLSGKPASYQFAPGAKNSLSKRARKAGRMGSHLAPS